MRNRTRWLALVVGAGMIAVVGAGCQRTQEHGGKTAPKEHGGKVAPKEHGGTAAPKEHGGTPTGK